MTSHSKSRLGVQQAVRGMARLSMVIWLKEKPRSKRETLRSLPRESRISSTRGMGSFAKELMEFSFFYLVVMRTLLSFLGIATIGLEYKEVECWIRPAARYWSMTASAFMARIGFIRYGGEVMGVLSGGMVILDGTEEREPKSVLDVEKTSGTALNVAQVVKHRR